MKIKLFLTVSMILLISLGAASQQSEYTFTGNKAFYEGNYGKAAENYEKALKEYDEKKMPKTRQQYIDAESQYKKSLECIPLLNSANTLFSKAETVDEYELAIMAYQILLESNRWDPIAQTKIDECREKIKKMTIYSTALEPESIIEKDDIPTIIIKDTIQQQITQTEIEIKKTESTIENLNYDLYRDVYEPAITIDTVYSKNISSTGATVPTVVYDRGEKTKVNLGSPFQFGIGINGKSAFRNYGIGGGVYLKYGGFATTFNLITGVEYMYTDGTNLKKKSGYSYQQISIPLIAKFNLYDLTPTLKLQAGAGIVYGINMKSSFYNHDSKNKTNDDKIVKNGNLSGMLQFGLGGRNVDFSFYYKLNFEPILDEDYIKSQFTGTSNAWKQTNVRNNIGFMLIYYF